MATAILLSFHRRKQAFQEPYAKYIAIVLIVTFFVGAVYTNYTGMLYSLLMIAMGICAFYLRSVMTRYLFNRMMDCACLCGIASVGVAILQKLYYMPQDPSYRPVSTFTNANYFGMMMEFLLLISIYKLFDNKQEKWKYGISLSAAILGIYLSSSMSAVASASAAVLVMLLIKQKFRLVAIISAAGGICLLLLLLFPEIFPRILAADDAWSSRLSIWSTALKGIRDHPLFGGGAMTYQMIYPHYYGYATYHAHNLLIDMLLNFGFVGTGALFVYFGTQIKLLVLRFRSHLFGDMNMLLVASFVCVVVHGMTDVTIFWIQTGMLFLLICSSMGIHEKYFYGGTVELQPSYSGIYGNRWHPTT